MQSNQGGTANLAVLGRETSRSDWCLPGAPRAAGGSPAATGQWPVPPGSGLHPTRGAVLLEVVLALVLFAAAAAIIGAGLHSAVNGVERQKLGAHAINLAVSVLSEIQMGLRNAESAGPEPFESPFDHWTWQLVVTPTETEDGEPGDLTLVEVIIRHDDPAQVQRLAQVLKLPKKSTATLTAAAGLQP